MRFTTAMMLSLMSVGCATIVNDPNIPLAFTFSDGSSGHCDFRNKRGNWSAELPATNVMIRRSDDELVYNCKTEDGREATGAIRSEIEGEKMAASVIFWDLGITDAITDKHRTYQGNVVIPVSKASGSNAGDSSDVSQPDAATVDPLSMSVGESDESNGDDSEQSDIEPR